MQAYMALSQQILEHNDITMQAGSSHRPTTTHGPSRLRPGRQRRI